MRLTRRDRVVLFGPFVLVVTALLIGPAVLGLLATFTTYAPGRTTTELVGSANYAAVFASGQFLVAARNVAVFVLVAVPLELGIGFSLAYVLRRSFRGRGLWRVLLLVPWLVSPIANGVMWHFLFSDSTGLLNYGLAAVGLPSQPSPLSQHGLALLTTIGVEVWRTSPLVAFLLLPSLSAISDEKWEHATIEGASWFSQVRHVALPSIRPIVLAVTMLLTGAALGTFDTVLILTGGGPGSETMTPALFSYQQAFGVNNWPVGATSAWLIVLAVLVVGGVYLTLARRVDS